MSESDMRNAICGRSSLIEALLPDVACAFGSRLQVVELLHAHLRPHARAQGVDDRQSRRRLDMPEGPAVARLETLCQCADTVDRADRFAKRQRSIRAHQRLMPLLGVDERDAWHHQPAL